MLAVIGHTAREVGIARVVKDGWWKRDVEDAVARRLIRGRSFGRRGGTGRREGEESEQHAEPH